MRDGSEPVETFSLKDLGVTEGPPDPAFDTVVALAAQSIGTCYASLAIVDHDLGLVRSRSRYGYEASPQLKRVIPFERSLTALVVTKGACLVVNDTRKHPRTAYHPYLAELGVRSLLAAPVYCPANEAVAALAVLDRLPRIWTDRDKRLIENVAFLASQSILLKAALWTIGTVARTRPAFDPQD